MKKINLLFLLSFTVGIANANHFFVTPGPWFVQLINMHITDNSRVLLTAGENANSSPCSAFSASNSQRATAFLFDEGYSPGFRQLESANGPGVETESGCLFGIDQQSGRGISLPQINTLSKNSVSIYANPPGVTVTAIAHSHPQNVFPAPSAGDIYAFGNYAQSHPGFLYYVLAANGAKYVLTVINQDELTAFLRKYPQERHIEADSLGNAGKGANYKRDSEMYLSMQKIATMILSSSANPEDPAGADLDRAHEAVQAYILDHYKTGISLLKQDADGNFNEIHTLINAKKNACTVVTCE